jgi:hypothetical protein
MKGLVLHSRVEHSAAVHGYTDVHYFRDLARRFRRINSDWDIHIEQFDEHDETEFLADIAKPEYRNLDVFAYIGHGGQHNLYSSSIGGAAETASLATNLTNACNNNAAIIFYACNAGKLGDSILRDVYNLTTAKNFKLYGHSTLGRAGNNPNKTVFPPANGAMLIDRCLGELASAPKFRTAWNQRFRNEADSLWARFFRLTEQQLFEEACRDVLRRARRGNQRYMTSLGWGNRLADIFPLIMPALDAAVAGPLQAFRAVFPSHMTAQSIYAALISSEAGQTQFAIAVAHWQFGTFDNPRNVDGIIGPGTWRRLQAAM